MFILARTVVYGTSFVGFLLVFLPARVLARSGVVAPVSLGALQIAGVVLAAGGAGLALACILSFVRFGQGTPAPFDPPRVLVARGPYRVMRNPMYAGATIVLLGVALYYASWALGLYAVVFLAVAYTFVRLYEEPALRRRFGASYDIYRTDVPGWWPRTAPRRR